MRGLVEKLRTLADPNMAFCLGNLWNGLDEAADEIERLRAELAAEREKSTRIEKETIEECVKRINKIFDESPSSYSRTVLQGLVRDSIQAEEKSNGA